MDYSCRTWIVNLMGAEKKLYFLMPINELFFDILMLYVCSLNGLLCRYMCRKLNC